MHGTDVLTSEPRTALRAMAVPIVISLLVAQINAFADTFWCSGLGGEALAALGLGIPMYAVVAGIGNGLGIGISAAGANRIGAGKRAEAAEIVRQAIPAMLIVSLAAAPLFLLAGRPVVDWMGSGGSVSGEAWEYCIPCFICSAAIIMPNIYAGALRAEGDARRSMYILAFGALLNMVLDPVFAYGLGYGISGLAWATSVSSAAAAVPVAYWYHVKKDTELRISYGGFRFRKGPVKAFSSIGVPKAVELDIFYIFNILMLYFFVKVGGPDGSALYNSAYKYVDLIGVIPAGIGGAIATVCSAQFGMGDFGRIRRTVSEGLKISLIAVTAAAAVLFVFSDWFAAVFASGDSAYLRADLARTIRLYCLFIPILVLRDIGSAQLQSIRMAGSSMASALIRNLEMTAAFWAASYFSLDAEWWALITGHWLGALLMWAWAEWGLRLREREHRKAEAGREAT